MNVLLEKWDTEFGLPPFERIRALTTVPARVIAPVPIRTTARTAVTIRERMNVSPPLRFSGKPGVEFAQAVFAGRTIVPIFPPAPEILQEPADLRAAWHAEFQQDWCRQ